MHHSTRAQLEVRTADSYVCTHAHCVTHRREARARAGGTCPHPMLGSGRTHTRATASAHRDGGDRVTLNYVYAPAPPSPQQRIIDGASTLHTPRTAFFPPFDGINAEKCERNIFALLSGRRRDDGTTTELTTRCAEIRF